MESKRQEIRGPSVNTRSGTARLVDDELLGRLASVGPRARKHVSDGHITPGTSIPSYQGFVNGTLNQEEIRQNYLASLQARPVHSIDEVALKRVRDEMEDDEGGDTDNDEETMAPSIDYNRKIYFRPNSHRSISSQHEDFEDAPFLHPQR